MEGWRNGRKGGIAFHSTMKGVRTMKNPKILFFVRGLGLGHATRDLTIAKQISEMDNDVELKFVSCAAGAKFLSGNSYPLIDTELPAMGKDGERVAKYTFLINSEKPDIIVTDEELPVIPLATGSGIPCALITNWFQADNPEIVDIFSRATFIIVPDYKEGFHMELIARERILWAGPIWTKETGPNPNGREEARKSLELNDSVKLLLLMCGQGDIMDIPFIEKSIAVYLMLDFPMKLIVLAGQFQKLFSYVERETDNITVMGHVWDLERYIQASDLAITRGGHTSLWELAMMGIPSISIPRPKQISPLNESYAMNMRARGTTVVVKEEEFTEELLKEKIELILTNERIWRKMSRAGLAYSTSNGASVAAEAILTRIANL